MYSYREALKKDVKEWMADNHEGDSCYELEYDYDAIYDACFVADEVTGNASGSYTFNRLEAKKNFFEDENADDYVYRMVEEDFTTFEEIGRHIAVSDWEWLDVCIRCYLLSEVVQEVITELDF